jgi:hypothetical protein
MKPIKMIFALCALMFSLQTTAMYKLDYDIKIGNYQLQAIDKVTIETSQELLSDSCRISIPGMVAGRAIQVEDKIKRGDAVTVRLGYNGDLVTEFTGYLKAIYPDNPMVLECEDSVYLFRKAIQSKILKNTTVRGILDYVLAQVNPQLKTPFTLVSDLSGGSYKWDTFAIHEATGFEVLDKLRQESGLMIYAKDNKLHYHLAYTQKGGQAIYDFSVNVEATNDLKYVKSQDAKVKVIVVGRTTKGAKVEGEAGESGGESRTIQRPTITDKKTLENIAREELKKLTYDGYRGDIRGWLIPYCSTGFTAKIRDQDYQAREGNYYVVATKVEFSQNGGVRTVSLGAKLS